MEKILRQLERNMTGLNFCTSWGFKALGIAYNTDELKDLIQKAFPEAKPFETSLVEISPDEFWSDIQSCMDYRGDEHSGMRLSPAKAQKLNLLQAEFKTKLRENMNSDSKFYCYASELGIPGYPVYWEFRLIFNQNQDWYFVYGSASD